MTAKAMEGVGGAGSGTEFVAECGRRRFLEKLGWLENTPSWALSAVLHLIVVLILINVVREVRRPAGTGNDTTTVSLFPTITKPPATKPILNPFVQSGLERKENSKLPEVPEAKEQFGHPQGPEMPGLSEGDSLDKRGSDGRDPTRESRDISESALGIGTGEDAARYGILGGEGDRRRGVWDTGGKGKTPALDRALEWLRRHQSPDGSWKSAGFQAQCAQACRNADPGRHGPGAVLGGHDVGVTGLAMLAYAGIGYTHFDGEYMDYVDGLKKAVVYLKGVQDLSDDPAARGRYGPAASEQWIYDHAIATLAMCELYIMSGDLVGLKRSVTEAVKLCLRAQNDGRGWRYGVKPGENDTSVTGWMVLVLKAARNANLDIPGKEYERAFAGALRWIDYATAANGKTGYIAPGDSGSQLLEVHPEPYPFSKELSSMTAVGVLCRLFAGERTTSKPVRDGVKILSRNLPDWREARGRALSTINMYYWYYGSYALFQYGGKEWERWNAAMTRALLASQRLGVICEDGSWDPIDEWGPAGGRVYMTALGAMTLEVYYRYMRMTK